MKEKYPAIDLLKYIPLNSYVELYPDFRKEFFKRLITKAGSRSHLKEIFNVNIETLDGWIYGKHKRIPFKRALEFSEFLGLNINDLSKHIKSQTALFNAGAISIEECKLPLNEELFEWLGFMKGDGCLSEKTVSCSNTAIDVCVFFAEIIERYFGVNKDNIYVQIIAPQGKHAEDAKSLEDILRDLGYHNIRIYKADKTKKAKRFVLTFSFHSKVLSQLLINFMKDLKDLIKNSPSHIKAAYVRGFSCAEGCASESKIGVRIITITQKDVKELEFIKTLLEDLGITNIDGPRFTGTASRIGITTQIELEKFQELIGFGRHKLKNDALTSMIGHYKFSVYRKSRNDRYEEIIKIIRKQKQVTAKFLAKLLPLRYEYVSYFLRDMQKKGMIDIDKTRIPYIYSLGEGLDQN